ETDFVAKNPEFIDFVTSLAKKVVAEKPASTEAFQAATKDQLAEKIAKIGENMTVRRFARAEGVLGTYIHMGGKIGVIVELEGPNNDTVKALAKDIAMQVAASSPQWLRREEADQKTLDNERNIAREKAKADGKPDKIIDKIAEGQ